MDRKSLPLAAMAQPAAESRREVLALAGTYGPRILRAAQRVVGDAALAEDIQQEVFLRLLQEPPERVESWPAYLTTMATRLAIDTVRKRQRRSRLLGMFSRQDAPRSPEELSLAGELGPALRAALASLSAREAEVFSLRYLSDFTVAQVADALGLKPNNIGVILHRARHKLAARLSLTDNEVSP